jgi:hypothetical protein
VLQLWEVWFHARIVGAELACRVEPGRSGREGRVINRQRFAVARNNCGSDGPGSANRLPGNRGLMSKGKAVCGTVADQRFEWFESIASGGRKNDPQNLPRRVRGCHG